MEAIQSELTTWGIGNALFTITAFKKAQKAYAEINAWPEGVSNCLSHDEDAEIWMEIKTRAAKEFWIILRTESAPTDRQIVIHNAISQLEEGGICNYKGFGGAMGATVSEGRVTTPYGTVYAKSRVVRQGSDTFPRVEVLDFFIE